MHRTVALTKSDEGTRVMEAAGAPIGRVVPWTTVGDDAFPSKDGSVGSMTDDVFQRRER